MVKNQNWQRRVESAKARRQETRACKARKNDRDAYRRQASDLLSYLSSASMEDIVGDTKSSEVLDVDIHVWVDKPPCSPKQVRSDFDQDECSKRKIKKSTPRKLQSDECDNGQPLCSDHFFFDRCTAMDGKGKGIKGRSAKAKTLCKMNHIEGPAISSVLNTTANIEASAEACRQACAFVEPGAIEMLWYLQTTGGTERSLNEALQSCLSEHEIGSVSLVYVVVGTTLMYDRYRGGVLSICSEAEVAEPIFNSEERKGRHRSRGESLGSITESSALASMRCHRRSRGESMGSIADTSGSRKLSFQRSRSESIAESTGEGEGCKEERCLLLDLPCSVLEGILLFLPDVYTAHLPLVCKTWRSDIGRNSPNLWRQLLKRRGWPVPVEGDTEAQSISATQAPQKVATVFRNTFTSHYQASRDLRSIEELFKGRRVRVERSGGIKTVYDIPDTNYKDATIISYESFPGTPRRGESGRTSSVKVWGPGKIIITSEDCTVRIFEATSTKGSLRCRQIVLAKISPEPNSALGVWCLPYMSVDEECVYCICKPADDSRSTHLMVVERERLLSSVEGGNDYRPSALDPDAIDSINLVNMAGTFAMQSEMHPINGAEEEVFGILRESQHERLHFLIDNIFSCGKGRLLISACFIVHDDQLLHESTPKRLFLYSFKDRQFVWASNFGVNECHVSGEQFPSNPPTSEPFRAIIKPKERYEPVTVQVDVNNSVLVDGEVRGRNNVLGAVGYAIKKGLENWEKNCDEIVPAPMVAPIVICGPRTTVIAHPFIVSYGPDDQCIRTMLSFSNACGDYVECMSLQDNMLVRGMHYLRSEYIVLHWEEVQMVGVHEVRAWSIPYISLIHIPTRHRIDQRHLTSGLQHQLIPFNVTLTTDGNIGMIALEVEGECLIMGGSGVRDLLASDRDVGNNGSDDQKSPSKKKKPKKRMAKKDGFARGMARYVN